MGREGWTDGAGCESEFGWRAAGQCVCVCVCVCLCGSDRKDGYLYVNKYIPQ